MLGDEIDGTAPSGDVYKEQWRALAGWFLGPRAENRDVFLDMFSEVFNMHADLRQNYFPADPAYITQEVRSSDAFKGEVADMRSKLIQAQEELSGSVPFFSPRYQAHMLWDATMPSLLGYMSAMLYNQNNVDTAASPVTTLCEKKVGLQLCSMLGYEIDVNKEPHAWGHITCGGSVANMEALWAARNMKFHAIGLREALRTSHKAEPPILSSEEASRALGFKLTIHGKNSRKIAIGECEDWDLLNLDVDEICSLSKNVINEAGLGGNTDEEAERRVKLGNWIEKHSYTSVGAHRFMTTHALKHDPTYTCPANNHYSWPKGGTLLGLGSDALTAVPLDVNFRQDVEALRTILLDKLEKRIPVLSVTAVMGSTEESAVDPLSEILALREKMKAQGLNFAILADGAWGGYFKTMLVDAPVEKTVRSFDYVPYTALTKYVKQQYSVLQCADTITIDPHKSGFCPYPSGALCYRNGDMKSFIAIMHPEVYHGEDDPTMGVYGIEGSKPGAAAVGVLMSHNVIGLDKFGYGRILGQCTTTAKLFYCLWLVLAREEDPFTCAPLQQLPAEYTHDQARKIIDEHIMGKPMHEIEDNDIAKSFLEVIGPDTLINTFVVNPKNNSSVARANELQKALSDELKIQVGQSAKRVRLIIMQSGLNAKNHGKGLIAYKKRLLLDSDDGSDLNVMVNTTMNPWQSNESIKVIGDIFRVSVLNCLGKLDDKLARHSFVVCGDIAADGTIFVEYLAEFRKAHRQYHCVAKFKFSEDETKFIRQCQEEEKKNGPIILRTYHKVKLYSLLNDCGASKSIMMRVYSQSNWKQPLEQERLVSVDVVDVPLYRHLDMSKHSDYYKQQTYFLFGDEKRCFMSHCFVKSPDFQQVVSLDETPHSLAEVLKDLGLNVIVETVNGSPLIVNDRIHDPLQAKSYSIGFRGLQYVQMSSTAFLEKENAKIYFRPLA